MRKSPAPSGAQPPATVALLNWAHLIEDFLDNVGVSFEAFRDEFRGSWICGYLQALQLAGVRPVWFCVSGRVRSPLRFTHLPTGVMVCVLPAPVIYRLIRRRLLNPYAPTVEQAAGDLGRLSRPLFAALKDLAPYLATPLLWLARELRRERCVALLCQEYEHARFDACVLLGRLMRLPVYATFQGGDQQLSRLERPLRPLTVRRAAGLIVAPRAEADRVSARYRLPPGKLMRVFNPVDVTAWHPVDRADARAALGIPTHARVVAWHGQVQLRRKGLDVLLEAWERLRPERADRDVRLLLVGAGEDADELRERIAGRQLGGVHWIDRFVNDQADLRCHLSAADVYAFPSRHEGFAVAPLEAMACGLPVVGTDALGVADLLEGGEQSGGVVVPAGDAAALALALGQLLDDPARSRSLGERARRRVEACCSLAAVGARLRAFLLSGESPAAGPVLCDV